jgi:hypothetical protein
MEGIHCINGQIFYPSSVSHVLLCRPILVLGILWQIIKIQLLSQISLRNFPELVVLLHDGEDMATLMKLSPEDILLRWFNYHLARSNLTTRRVTNFGNDVKVCIFLYD